MNSSKGDSAKLEQLHRHIDELQKGIAVRSISPEARNQLQTLLNLPEDAWSTIVQERILNSLAFDGMRGRFEAVHDAHYKTFEWIFESHVDKNDHPGRSGSESFKDWLAFGHDIFHISGKLGSGKSTLMKFLYEHGKTKEQLETWAGKLQLKKLFFHCIF